MKTARICKRALVAAVLLLAFGAGSVQAALQAHYKFDETSGTTLVDSSSNVYNGTIVGSEGSLDADGKAGTGFKPGGVNNHYGKVSGGVTSFGVGGNNARTIAFWFNTPSFPSGEHAMIGMGTGAGSQFNISAEVNDSKWGICGNEWSPQ